MWERNFGFPRFKKRVRIRSFVFPQFKNNPVVDNKIKLPVIGIVGFRKSRPIPEEAKVKQARIVKRVSGWYTMVTLQWDVNVPSPVPQGKALGIDVGLSAMVATSNGLLVKRPRFFVNAVREACPLGTYASLNCCKAVFPRNRKAQIIGIRHKEKLQNSMNTWLIVVKIGIENFHINYVRV